MKLVPERRNVKSLTYLAQWMGVFASSAQNSNKTAACAFIVVE